MPVIEAEDLRMLLFFLELNLSFDWLIGGINGNGEDCELLRTG